MLNLKHGDRVTFVDRFGAERTGRVNGLLVFPDHVVLDMGGRHGTPQVVDWNSTIVGISRVKVFHNSMVSL